MTRAPSQLALIFERQWLHALLLGGLLSGVVAAQRFDGVRGGELWGVATPIWLWAAIATAVLHQALVWFCWRTQLHASLVTATLGERGFAMYAALFAILGIARVVGAYLLAVSNQHSLPANLAALRALAAVLAIPALYLFYSVTRYFGYRRAMGIDHFDPSYRTLPFVRKGIFRFTRNGMYVYGFLVLWLPGLWFASWAALLVALFNHLYIWVHYLGTELPDIRRIYGDAKLPSDSH